jgi:hypothetical protein
MIIKQLSVIDSVLDDIQHIQTLLTYTQENFSIFTECKVLTFKCASSFDQHFIFSFIRSLNVEVFKLDIIHTSLLA